jgi:hypothetical protein
VGPALGKSHTTTGYVDCEQVEMLILNKNMFFEKFEAEIAFKSLNGRKKEETTLLLTVGSKFFMNSDQDWPTLKKEL